MSYLITSSFIDAVEWLENAPTSMTRDGSGLTWKEKAYKDLRGQLAREPWGEPDPVVTRGMTFENTVYDTLEKNKDKDKDPEFKCSAEFQIFLDKCRGGLFQKKLKRFEEIDGREFCLYGKADVWMPKKIIDIKTCVSYGGSSKYLNKFQHLLYLYITDIEDFEYLVAEFGEAPNMKIKRVVPITYQVASKDTLQEMVIQRIRKAVGFIEQDEELWKLYTTTFSRY